MNEHWQTLHADVVLVSLGVIPDQFYYFIAPTAIAALPILFIHHHTSSLAYVWEYARCTIPIILKIYDPRSPLFLVWVGDRGEKKPRGE